MWIVECFWYRDSEIKAFKTYDEASEHMRKDFLSCLQDYDRNVDNEGRVFYNNGDEDFYSFIDEKRAQIHSDDIVEDNLTWKIYEIKEVTAWEVCKEEK